MFHRVVSDSESAVSENESFIDFVNNNVHLLYEQSSVNIDFVNNNVHLLDEQSASVNLSNDVLVTATAINIQPSVNIKLDTYTGTQLSTDVDKQNIVPFTECVHEIKLTVNGTHYMRWQLPLILAYSITTHKSQSMTAHNGIVYEPSKNKPFARGLPYVAISRATDIEKVALLSPIRPDHFINKTFIAENIKITEFYNNLNKKFNSDEEI